jgi:ABC-type nitrate/sulfonate/bicarbonate transport system substrate-binding protein
MPTQEYSIHIDNPLPLCEVIALRTGQDMKSIAPLSVVLVLLLLSSSQSAEPTKVIIGVAVPTLADLPLYFGVDKGFYKTENLEVVQVFFRSVPTVAQALVAGSILFSTGFGSGTRAAMLGAPIKGIMGFQNKSPMVLYARLNRAFAPDPI